MRVPDCPMQRSHSKSIRSGSCPLRFGLGVKPRECVPRMPRRCAAITRLYGRCRRRCRFRSTDSGSNVLCRMLSKARSARPFQSLLHLLHVELEI